MRRLNTAQTESTRLTNTKSWVPFDSRNVEVRGPCVMGVLRIDGMRTKTQKPMRTLNEDQPIGARFSRWPVTAPASQLVRILYWRTKE